MKSLLVFLALVAISLAALTPEQISKLEPISKECREKTGVTQEQINKARQQLLIDGDSKVRKHALCVGVKTGILSESGDFNINIIKEKLKRAGASDETVANIERNCFVKKATPEDTAFDFAKCVAPKQSNFSPAD